MSFLDSILGRIGVDIAAKTIQIDGRAVPLETFKGLVAALPVAVKDVAAGDDLGEVLRDAAPDALPAIEALANIFIPGLGTGIELAALLLAMSHPMTREEEEVWFSRQDSTEGQS